MSRLTFVIIFMSSISSMITAQGVQWSPVISWEQTKADAAAADKPIYIDFYTTWCRPCRVMDKAVYSDSVVGQLLNNQFISIKLNAEDGALGSQLARRYHVKSYPGSLYLHADGTILHHTEGQLSVYELVTLSYKVQDLKDNFPLIAQAKEAPQADYTHEELATILTLAEIHSFAGKKYLTMRYLDGVKDITEDDLRIVMDQAQYMDLPYLKRLSPLTASLSYEDIYLRRNKKEWLQWKLNIERAIYDHLDRYKKTNDLRQYEATLEILKDGAGIKSRQIDELYLSFYKQNDLDQYKTFATYFVDEYIIPTRPEDVHIADQEKYKVLHQEVARDMQATLKRSKDIVVVDKTQQNSKLDSLIEIYTISRRIADQLYEISGDFFALYEDESARRKARFWASLSHKYYPYDWKYFDNHIYILQATGYDTEATIIQSEAKSLPWYDEMIKKNQENVFGG